MVATYNFGSVYFIRSVKYMHKIFNFHMTWLVFLDIINYSRQNGGLGIAKFPRLTSWQYAFNVSKQCYWMALKLVRQNSVFVGVA